MESQCLENFGSDKYSKHRKLYDIYEDFMNYMYRGGARRSVVG
jgi:hypothetical protein